MAQEQIDVVNQEEEPVLPEAPIVYVPEGELIGEAIVTIEGNGRIIASVNGEEIEYQEPITLEVGTYSVEAWAIDGELSSEVVRIDVIVAAYLPPFEEVISYIAEIVTQVENNTYVPKETETGITFILEDKGESSSIYDLENQNIVAIIKADGTIIKNDESNDLNAQYVDKVKAEMQSLETDLHYNIDKLLESETPIYKTNVMLYNGKKVATLDLYEINIGSNSYFVGIGIQNDGNISKYVDEFQDNVWDHMVRADGEIDYTTSIKDVPKKMLTVLVEMYQNSLSEGYITETHQLESTNE